jgi:hypothetical protein
MRIPFSAKRISPQAGISTAWETEISVSSIISAARGKVKGMPTLATGW